MTATPQGKFYPVTVYTQDIPCAVEPECLISAGPGYAGLPACLNTQCYYILLYFHKWNNHNGSI